ncbi:MAG: phospholipid carrier-dependent glycosyltransferase, partial [Gemmatimonadetes bacterium]|nr:phospholipid carrier-dependent glycosyltransferase [Gemmatimonadota bacterium]
VHFSRARLDPRSALFAGTMMATSLGFMVLARAAIADALLNLWLCLAMFDIWRWIESPGRPALLRVYLWMALGVLTKGPVAILVPAGASLLWFGFARDLRTWTRCVFDPLGIAVLVSVAGPWYLAQFSREGMAFIDGFFVRHNLDRFSSPMEGHSGGFLYYVPVVALAVLPYTGLLPRTLHGFRGAWQDRLDRFLWCWFLFVFGFFSLSGTKLPHYALLGATPLVLLMARHRSGVRSRVAWSTGPTLLWCALLLVPSMIEPVQEQIQDPHFADLLSAGSRSFGTGFRVAAIVGLASSLALPAIFRREPWKGAIGTGLITAALLATIVVPSFGDLLQGPVRRAALRARDLGEPAVRYGLDTPSVSVYRRSITRARPPEPGELVLTQAARLDELRAQPGASFDVLFEERGIVLARRFR